MNIDDLAQRCAEETEKFYRGQINDTQYCYELFRLALAEEISDAVTWVRQIYEPQMLKKIYGNSLFRYASESAEDIAHMGFIKCYLNLRRENFANYKDVAPILSYWHRCIWTTLREVAAPVNQTPEDNEGTQAPPEDFFALWEHICTLLPEECDQLLVQSRYINRQKPATIAQDHPDCWDDSHAVSVRLYQIKSKLFVDVGLRQWAGLES